MTGTYSDLVSHVASRDQCAAFLQGSDVGFDRLLEVLNYLLRWVLPFKTPLREFVDVRRSGHLEHLEALREQGIRTNLDLLEAGRTPSGRARLSSAARVPGVFLVALVHRADISRLAY